MSRIPAINPSEATGKVKELLDAVQTKLGVTPNIFTNYFNEAAKTEIDFPRVELPLKRSVSKT
jgi:hypothetical protein